MPDSFEFTIPSPTVALPADRTGSVVIDVTSRLDRHGSVSIEVLPGSTGDAAWFGAPDPFEFDLPIGETRRTTLPISVPAGAAAGQYEFTVRAAAVDHPQVDFTESPSLSITVPEPAAPSGIPSWIFIVIGVLVVVVLALAGWFLFRPGPDEAFPDAPNLVGKTLTDAEDALDPEQDMRVYSEQADVSGSCVLLQSPPPESSTLNISVLAVPCPQPRPEVRSPEVLEGLCDNATVRGFCGDVEAFFGEGYVDDPAWTEATDKMFADFQEAFQRDGVIVDSVVGRTETQGSESVSDLDLGVAVIPDGSGGPQCVLLQHPVPDNAAATGATVTLVTTRCPNAADTPELVVLQTQVADDGSNVCAIVAGYCTAFSDEGDDVSDPDFAAQVSSMMSAFRNSFTGDVVPRVTGSTLGGALTALEDKDLEAAYAYPESDTTSPVFLRRCFTVVGQNPSEGTLIANLSTSTVNLQLEEYDCPFIKEDQRIGDDLIVLKDFDFDTPFGS